jgi:hypothetical protein
MTMRVVTGWLGGLSLLWVAGAAQPPRDLPAGFRRDFRVTDFRGEALLPVGAGEVYRDDKGLRITFPAGQRDLRDTGVFTTFSVRGDFQVTLAFEVLKAGRPKSGPGVGPLLYAGNPTETDAVVLARRLLPGGKAVFVAERVLQSRGKAQRRTINTLPSAAATGTLRLERRGATVRYRVREGDAGGYTTVAESDFGKADVYAIEAGGTTGGSERGLDLRLLDLAVRAQALPGLEYAGPKRAGPGPTGSTRPSWRSWRGRFRGSTPGSPPPWCASLTASCARPRPRAAGAGAGSAASSSTRRGTSSPARTMASPPTRKSWWS